VKPVTRERIRSLSRRTEVELVVIRPEDAPANLPVCLALHGRGEGAGMFVDLGVPEMLSSVVNYQGTHPFAVVAVDGGDSYWVARDEEDDPQQMLTDELPGWLEERGLATNPFAVLGISMGGYGAFNYAANYNDPAIAAISPALFLDWPEASARDAFPDKRHWTDTDPLQNLNTFAGVPLGVWCGESDPFIDATRELVDLAKPAVADIGPGDHDAAFWHKVLPDALKFVGNRIG
jgi:S-formylglutathione hydrolase FrmB